MARLMQVLDEMFLLAKAGRIEAVWEATEARTRQITAILRQKPKRKNTRWRSLITHHLGREGSPDVMITGSLQQAHGGCFEQQQNACRWVGLGTRGRGCGAPSSETAAVFSFGAIIGVVCEPCDGDPSSPGCPAAVKAATITNISHSSFVHA